MHSTLLVQRSAITLLAFTCLAGCDTCLDIALRDATTLAPIHGARVMATPWSLPRPDNAEPVDGVTDAQGMVTLDRIGSRSFIELRVDAPGHPALMLNVHPPLPADYWERLRTLQGGAGDIEARIRECDH